MHTIMWFCYVWYCSTSNILHTHFIVLVYRMKHYTVNQHGKNIFLVNSILLKLKFDYIVFWLLIKLVFIQFWREVKFNIFPAYRGQLILFVVHRVWYFYNSYFTKYFELNGMAYYRDKLSCTVTIIYLGV